MCCWIRWNWRSTKPQNTYATFMVIGQYDDLRFSTAPDGTPIAQPTPIFPRLELAEDEEEAA